MQNCHPSFHIWWSKSRFLTAAIPSFPDCPPPQASRWLLSMGLGDTQDLRDYGPGPDGLQTPFSSCLQFQGREMLGPDLGCPQSELSPSMSLTGQAFTAPWLEWEMCLILLLWGPWGRKRACCDPRQLGIARPFLVDVTTHTLKTCLSSLVLISFP